MITKIFDGTYVRLDNINDFHIFFPPKNKYGNMYFTRTKNEFMNADTKLTFPMYLICRDNGPDAKTMGLGYEYIKVSEDDIKNSYKIALNTVNEFRKLLKLPPITI